MNTEIAELINNLAGEGVLQKEENFAGNLEYSCRNELKSEFIGRLLFTSNFEPLYMECNGYSNSKYSRGEALEYSDIKNFVESVRHTEPRVRKSGIFRKEAIILNQLVLDKKI